MIISEVKLAGAESIGTFLKRYRAGGWLKLGPTSRKGTIKEVKLFGPGRQQSYQGGGYGNGNSWKVKSHLEGRSSNIGDH